MVDIASSLTSALGVSSGINTTQLVSDLTSATYEPKLTNINALISTNNSRISALGSARSALQTFSDALSKLLESTAYSGQPVSNDPSIVAVSLTGGGQPAGLPAQIEVEQLAAAQVLQSTTLAEPTDRAGTGTLNLTVGDKSFEITLDEEHSSLVELAAAINKSGAGVNAAIVTDQNGARLVLKGKTGETQAFTLTAGPGADADLQRFTWDGTSGGMARSQTAANALIKIDNVAMTFDSNEITTAIPNLRLDLNKAVPGSAVTIATDQPTSSMKELVQEIVTAYNSLKGSLNTAMRTSNGEGSSSGLLSNDSGMRDMSNRLARLVGTQLTTDGPFKTLNDLGISTNRDGTLSLDTTKLQKALTDDPEAVTQMLNPTIKDADHVGIAGALKSISDYLTGTNGPLTASQSTYENLSKNYQKQLDRVNEDKANYTDRLTKTYTAMQSKLLQFKATQSYLEQQIAAWNNNG